jgi:3',5'-cyclic AMP phosphodiesterase CpdA
MRFLHCSDVHVTENYAALPWRRLGWRRLIALLELQFGGRARDYLEAPQTLRQIVVDVERRKADHLIVSGDLTAYALEAEFMGAREALGSLAEDKSRCTIIPGNHDTYTPGAHRTRRFERHFGHLLESDMPEYAREGAFPFVRVLDGEAAVVGLSSARVPPVPGLSFGVIGRRQLDGLRELIHDPRLEGHAILVVVHHAPIARSGRKDRFFHGLVDAAELFRILRGPRYAVLHGHIHHRYHHEATAERPHTFGAGSSTQRGREGYWVIEVKNGRIAGGEAHTPGS